MYMARMGYSERFHRGNRDSDMTQKDNHAFLQISIATIMTLVYGHPKVGFNQRRRLSFLLPVLHATVAC